MRAVLTVVATLAFLLSGLPHAAPGQGHCATHPAAAHQGHHHGQDAPAPEPCPHCPPALCSVAATCGAGVLSLASGEASATLPAPAAPPPGVVLLPLLSRHIEPAFPPPRSA